MVSDFMGSIAKVRTPYRLGRQCLNSFGRPKVKHPSGNEALSAARLLTQDKGVKFFPYQCATCGSWHVGRPRLDPVFRLEVGGRVFWNEAEERRQGTVARLKHLLALAEERRAAPVEKEQT